MTQEEKIIEGYVELQKDKLLGMEANALRVLCEDYLERAKKDREMRERIKDWQSNNPPILIDRSAPPQILHYAHAVPMNVVAKLLMELSDKLKEEITRYNDISELDKDCLMQDISNACSNFDKEIRNHISR